MKNKELFFRSLCSAAVASCLMAEGPAWAAEARSASRRASWRGRTLSPGSLSWAIKRARLRRQRLVPRRRLVARSPIRSRARARRSSSILGPMRRRWPGPELLKLSNVRYVERNGILRLPPQPTPTPPPKPGLNSTGKRAAGDLSSASVSTDPGGGFQYHLAVIRKTAALPALSATPPTVAVIDTGVDYTHPDLAGKVILGLNAITNNSNPFDDNEHGTHVAGIIAAKGGNGAYGEGVCPNCKILAVKVLDATGSGTDFDVALGMAWTVTNRNTTTPPTKVVNMSLGGAASATIAEQVLAMKNAGMVLVAAAGNDNTTSTTDAFPGADPNVALRVMATEQQDCRAWFSNFSPAAMPGQYNIAAPGWNISSTTPEAGYAPMSGTSMASPVVAGAAALVWGQIASLTRDTLVARLVNNGKSINCGFAAPTRRVDVRKAITGVVETALIGRVLDPFTGKAPAPSTTGSTAQLLSGATVLNSDLTDKAGFYETDGPCSRDCANAQGHTWLVQHG